MKKLINPMIVGSWAIIASGLIPGVSIYMSLIGLATLTSLLIAGIHINGDEQQDWDAMVAKIDIDRSAMAGDIYNRMKKLDALEASVSKALSQLRDERRSGPLE